MAPRPWRSLHRDSRGSAAIEFAIVLPVLLMFLLGIIDMGRLAWTISTLDYATSSAARCEAINATACATVALTQAYAVSKALGMTLSAGAFTVTTPISPACGDKVSVTIAFVYFTPWIAPANSNVTESACYPSQPA